MLSQHSVKNMNIGILFKSYELLNLPGSLQRRSVSTKKIKINRCYCIDNDEKRKSKSYEIYK